MFSGYILGLLFGAVTFIICISAIFISFFTLQNCRYIHTHWKHVELEARGILWVNVIEAFCVEELLDVPSNCVSDFNVCFYSFFFHCFI